MSDNRLGISIGVSGDGEITRLEARIKSLREQLSNLGQSQYAGFAGFGAKTAAELSIAEAKLTQLRASSMATFSDITTFSTRAIAAMRGQADAVKGVEREMTALDAVTRAGASGNRLYTQSVRDAIAATTGLNNARLIATQHSERQKQLDQSFAHGTTPTSSNVNFSVASKNAQELARIQQMSARAAGAAAVQHMSLQQEIDKGFNYVSKGQVYNQTAVNDAEAAFGKIRRAAGEAGEVAGRGFWSRFMRGGRTGMSLFDEGMRGQRGQMMSTVGAGFRAAGMGGGVGVGALMGGVAVVGAAEGALHMAQAMGKLSEEISGAAEASGLSIHQFATLQGALILTGTKADGATSALRQFAMHIEQAMANPASRAAKALHAIGVSQDELISHGNDTYAMFMKVASALNAFKSSSVKGAAEEALFGRSDAALASMVQNYQKLTSSAQDYANAVDKNIDGGRQLAQETNALSLSWDTFKMNAIPALESVLNLMNQLISAAKSVVSAIGTVFSYGMQAEASVGLFLNKIGIPGFSSAPRFDGGWKPTSDMYHKFGGPMELPPVDVRPGIKPFDQPKPHHAGVNKETTSDIDALRKSLQGLKEDYRLVSEQQDAQVEHTRIAARISQGDKEISPQQRAKQDYSAARDAGVQKIAALDDLKSKTDSTYDAIIAKAQEIYKQDPKLYKEAIQEKINADKEFLIQHQQIQNQVDQKLMEVVEAHAQAVNEVVAKWGAAFDNIGDQLESTIGTAIKSAFEPMKPEYWWSSVQGPHGQPLMESHRINPTTQLLGQFGMSALGDLGKQLGSSITTAIGKSLFGEGTASIGQGIAKMLGIGTPGGFLGTGLGAVKSISTEATFATSVTAFASAVATFTGSVATMSASSAASGAGSAAGAVGNAGGFLSFLGGLPLIGGLFGGASAAGGAAAGASGAASALLAAASGGWDVPAYAGGGADIAGGLSILHPREMVLPANLAQGVRNMVAGGGASGGDNHLHLHAAAMDAPSMDRWFRGLIASNPGAIKGLFRNNALTPRSF